MNLMLNISKKTIVIYLIFTMIGTPIFAQYQNSEYVKGNLQGWTDGKADANFVWFLAGLGCGIFGWGAAALTNPTVPAGQLMGKTQDYVLGYMDGYKVRKKKQSTYAAIGWLVALVIYGAVISSAAEDN